MSTPQPQETNVEDQLRDRWNHSKGWTENVETDSNNLPVRVVAVFNGARFRSKAG
jgi:hypothetical protein